MMFLMEILRAGGFAIYRNREARMKHSWGGLEIIILAAELVKHPDRTGYLGEGLCLKLKSIAYDLNNVVTHLLRRDSANLLAECFGVSVQYFKNQPKLSILTSMLMVWLFQEL